MSLEGARFVKVMLPLPPVFLRVNRVWRVLRGAFCSLPCALMAASEQLARRSRASMGGGTPKVARRSK